MQNENSGLTRHTNFATFEALLDLSHAQDFIDDLHMGRVLQTPLGIASDFLQLVGSDAMASKLADNVKQQLNAICPCL